ncbi:glycosyl hydrolase family 5 [Paraburkholderia mimosarum]|uniref:glycosyl hydrolase family 5 n=1 Tax=Paraburkholderia mimosarum TaxID=312026 RepID=UPI0039C3A16A
MKGRLVIFLCAVLLAIAGVLHFKPASGSASPIVTLDGGAGSSGLVYITLPHFQTSRANTGVAVHEIVNMRLLDAARDVGFSFVRTDLFWDAVQKDGKFDFGDFDALVSALAARGMGALFILEGSHSIYSPGHPPQTELELAAFYRYVYRTVAHYRNANVRFEVWNEQDAKDFWGAEPSPSAYRNVLKTAVTAAKAANPEVQIASGGVQQIDRDFILSVGDIVGVTQRGPDAVGVHPYRQDYPETAFKDYRLLREDLARYRAVPDIWATEWSYPTYEYAYVSDIHDGHSPKARELQAKYVVRLFLVNWISQIGLTSYYDMRDDGSDPFDREHNFGLMDHDYGELPVYVATKHLFAFTSDVTRAQYFIDESNRYVVLKLSAPGVTRYVIWCYGDGNNIRLDTSHFPKSAIFSDMYGNKRPGSGVQSIPESMGPVFVSVRT